MESPATGRLSPGARPGGLDRARVENLSPEAKEARRKKRELLIVFLLMVVFASLTAAEFSIRHFRTLLPFNDSILFFSIININILLMLLMIFLIVRNLVKLVFERRRRILGAHLRTKLVAAFVLLSLVPTVVLFYVAWSFISRSIEMWVHVQVEQALDGALKVARNYYKDRAEYALYYARQIGQAVQREGFLEKGEKERLQEFLRLQQIAYRVDSVLLLDLDKKEILLALQPENLKTLFPPQAESVLKTWDGEETSRIRDLGKGEAIEAFVPISFNEGGRRRQYVLVLQNSVPAGLAGEMAQISQSLERHQQMMLYKFSFKSVFFMALIMVTLLIVFSATWFGFYLAKEITIPLQNLADGIREVAAGNLSYRIETGPEDEMGLLADSYNTMLEDLRRKGEEVADAQGRLRHTNEELEQRRRYMEILLRNVGAGVLSLDREGRIQTVNRFMEELFAVRAAAFLGKHYREFFFSESMQPVRQIIEEASRKRSRSLEHQVRLTLLQEPKTLIVRTSALEDENGQWVGIVMVFEDHSELIRAQRAAAWREVARRIAHEIKNPLTPIQLSAQRLQKRFLGRLGDDGAVFEECTSTIIRQVEQMKNLVNEFSQFARMPAVRPVLCDLNEIIGQVLALYRQAHPAMQFFFDAEPALPPLLLDPDQIQRALINLLDNAVDATRSAGEVRLRTEHNVFLQMVVLEVADDGAGIPEEMRDRVFEPYASTKRGGTGLGLVIVKTIVSGHSGYIRVRDNSPRGTRFFLEFPVPAA